MTGSLRNRASLGSEDKAPAKKAKATKATENLELPTPKVTETSSSVFEETFHRDRLLVLIAVVLPNLIALRAPEAFAFNEFRALFFGGGLTVEWSNYTTALFWLPVIGSCFERITYSYIWTHPQEFMTFCKKHELGEPMERIHKTFFVFKFSQLSTLAAWYCAVAGGPWAVVEYANSGHLWSPYRVLMGAVLVAVGQALNYGIYRAIGVAGVYYGTRLGHEIPWHTGFPFTVLSHCQYWGAIMTIWGTFLMVAQECHVAAGGVAICNLIAAMYCFTMYVESRL